ncbi:MAG: glycosyltransferase family 4 protein [Patescibacteria group bacterium]
MIKRVVDNKLFRSEDGRVYSTLRRERVGKKYRVAIIIDTAITIPPTTGVTYRLYYLSKELAKRGHKIVWVLGNRNFRAEDDLKELCAAGLTVHVLPPRLFYNAAYVSGILTKEMIEIVQYEITQTFVSLGLKIRQKTGLPVLLELHDVEATLMKTLGKKERSPLMAFLQHAAGEYADAVVTMTPLDYATLTESIGIQKEKVLLVPNGVSKSGADDVRVRKTGDAILFLGNLFYPPNQRGFVYVADELLPELNKRRRVVLKSIGMIPEGLRKKYRGRADIEILGEIKEKRLFRKEVRSASVGLCTVFAGSGMKTKVLDYCLAGLPVVATTIGASGYENVHGVIVRDEKMAIVNEIEKLLGNKKLAERIGRANKKDVIGLYGWPGIAKKFETALALADNFTAQNFREETFRPLWLEEGRHAVNVLDCHFSIKNSKIYKHE